jgi:hypothetical protein
MKWIYHSVFPKDQHYSCSSPTKILRYLKICSQNFVKICNNKKKLCFTICFAHQELIFLNKCISVHWVGNTAFVLISYYQNCCDYYTGLWIYCPRVLPQYQFYSGSDNGWTWFTSRKAKGVFRHSFALVYFNML